MGEVIALIFVGYALYVGFDNISIQLTRIANALENKSQNKDAAE